MEKRRVAKNENGADRGKAFGTNHRLLHSVHRTLGPGFLESIYEEALGLELQKAGLVFERQKSVMISYDGKPIGEHRLDYVIDGRVVLELKACKNIEDAHLTIAKPYLKATGLLLALVINFSKPVIEIRRVVFTA